MSEGSNFDSNRVRQFLQSWCARGRIWIVKAALQIGAIYRFKTTYLPILFICVGSPILFTGCANDNPEQSTKHSHRQHRDGAYGSGDSDEYDRSRPSRWATPIPGL